MKWNNGGVLPDGWGLLNQLGLSVQEPDENIAFNSV